MRRATYVSELRQDLAFAARQLTKNPGFAAVAILTLALGIGATTAIFSAVYAVVLQPLPLRDPSRLLVVGESMASMPGMLSDVSVGNFVDARAGTTTLRRARRGSVRQLQPDRRRDARARHRRAGVGGVLRRHGEPSRDRTRRFTRTEDQPGADGVVVLSHRLWVGRFGGAGVGGRRARAG